VKYIIFISGLIGLTLLYLLTSASANTALFSHHYSSLLVLTAILALGLCALVGYQLWQLRLKLKKQVFGAKLMLRLTIFFSLIAILPGLLVYSVSVQFLGKSIESWFDIRVEQALEGGLNLGRNSLESGLKELGNKGQLITLLLAKKSKEQYRETLLGLAKINEDQETAIFDLKGNLIISDSLMNKTPSKIPDSEMLSESIKYGQYSLVDVLANNQIVWHVLVPLNPENDSKEQRVLQLIKPVPQQFSADAEIVQEVYSDYQGLTLSREGLKSLYGITLTLSLLIVLLSAVSAAFILSGRLSSPLAALAEGTRAVAQGNFSGNYPVQSKDELGALTSLFNQMTAQLADAKSLGEKQQNQVENAKGYLENILTHLSSGVIVVDEQFKLGLSNTSAEYILGVDLRQMNGKSLSEIASVHVLLRPFANMIISAVKNSDADEWQRQIERISKNGNQILLLRGSKLKTASERGYAIVFDDITPLLQAERQAAWGEVARRLAHEIKNPLTPIQLSAERMELKLSGKLNEQDAQLLHRATQTIVSQVDAMKNMVADFADYARAPAPKLLLLDMHQLLNEVMGLYEANSSPVMLILKANQFTVNGDATRLRQIVHNLLHNAHDALQQIKNPQIEVITTNNETELQLIVSDNGSGIPEHVMKRIFEPYMTTKIKGTGLGLPIVKKIVEEHGGKITIQNKLLGGSCVTVCLPLVLNLEVV
jgi:PAS domain S-box-containing protein